MSSEDPERRSAYISSLLEEANCIICDDLLSLEDGDEDDDLSDVGELDGSFDSLNQDGLYFQGPSYSKPLVLAMPTPPLRQMASPDSATSKTKEKNLREEATPAASSKQSLFPLIGRADENTRKRTIKESFTTSQSVESSSTGYASWKHPLAPQRRKAQRHSSDMPMQQHEQKRNGPVNEGNPQQPSKVSRNRRNMAATQGKAPALRFQVKSRNLTNTVKGAFMIPRERFSTSPSIESSPACHPSWKHPLAPQRRKPHEHNSKKPKQQDRLKRKCPVSEGDPQQPSQQPSPVARKSCVATTKGKAPTPRFQVNPEKYTNPLNFAIQRGAPSCVLQELVEQFPSALCVKDGWLKETSLQVLLKYSPNDCETVDRMLLTKPICVSILDRHLNTPLHIACCRGASLDVVRHLYILYPEALEMRNSHGKTPIEVALGNTTSCRDQVFDFLLARREDCLRVKRSNQSQTSSGC